MLNYETSGCSCENLQALKGLRGSTRGNLAGDPSSGDQTVPNIGYPAPLPSEKYIVFFDDMNLREGPAFESKKIGIAEGGTAYTALNAAFEQHPAGYDLAPTEVERKWVQINTAVSGIGWACTGEWYKTAKGTQLAQQFAVTMSENTGLSAAQIAASSKESAAAGAAIEKAENADFATPAAKAANKAASSTGKQKAAPTSTKGDAAGMSTGAVVGLVALVAGLAFFLGDKGRRSKTAAYGVQQRRALGRHLSR